MGCGELRITTALLVLIHIALNSMRDILKTTEQKNTIVTLSQIAKDCTPILNDVYTSTVHPTGDDIPKLYKHITYKLHQITNNTHVVL